MQSAASRNRKSKHRESLLGHAHTILNDIVQPEIGTTTTSVDRLSSDYTNGVFNDFVPVPYEEFVTPCVGPFKILVSVPALTTTAHLGFLHDSCHCSDCVHHVKCWCSQCLQARGPPNC